jgi:Lon protease-like protein
MIEIPLFPLNTVLFPGTDLHLHIFEDRYKVMIASCIKKQVPFGVVLIKSGFEAYDQDVEIFYIGCTAIINRFNKLKDGNFNISVRGVERFRILSTSIINKPYKVAKIKMLPLKLINESRWEASFDDLSSLVNRYVNKLLKDSKNKLDNINIPDTPFELAMFSADLLQTSTLTKQKLLSLESVGDLLGNLVVIYRRELAILDVVLNDRESSSIGSFSIN